jgi:ATP-binding cassette subfamily F protein uup
LLAKLFAKPANVIVLDEPTNDLDAETLELLEEKLVQFSGTVLLVSHDRAFLNNVVTSTIVFENGGLREYDGGYDDWQRQIEQHAEPAFQEVDRNDAVKSKKASINGEKPRKLKFKEKRELEQLPDQIERLEAKIAEYHAAMAVTGFYQKPGPEIAAAQAELKELETALESAYARWEELEQFASA